MGVGFLREAKLVNQVNASSFLNPLPLNDNIERLRWYINELTMSFSGRMDVENYNIFLQESVEMLSNAITVFYEGYFDAAYYLVRSSIEVSTVGLYFSDAKDEEAGGNKASWNKRGYFPVQGKLLKKLAKDGAAFSEFHDKVPTFFDLVERRRSIANKIIHKQGYGSFYCIRNHPLHRKKYPPETLADEFTNYLRDAIGIVAVMRLAIDPFPVLLTDADCKNRFADSVTRPFSDDMIDECIGEEILFQYKTTDYYNSVKDWVIANFPLMSDAAYDAQQIGYIDVGKQDDLIDDIHLVSIHSACAILLTFLLPQVCNIYIFGGLEWYFNNRHGSLSSTLSTALFDQVIESGDDNYIYYSKRISGTEKTTDKYCTYLTARLIAEEEFVIESVSPLSSVQLKVLNDAVEELSVFYSKVRTGDLVIEDIKSTSIFQQLTKP